MRPALCQRFGRIAVRIASLATMATAMAGAFAPTTSAQTLIHFTTEDYPPGNFIDIETGSVTGILTEVVREMTRRTGISYYIDVLPWQRAYNAALIEPDTCVYGTNRTAEREPQFRWISPIVTGGWALFARADDPIEIPDIQAARAHKVAVPQGSAIETFVTDLGIPTEVSVSDRLNALKLARGRVRLWASGSHVGPYTARLLGGAKIRPVLFLRESEVGIACNLATNATAITRLNAALDALRAEGFISEVEARYR